MSSLGSRLSKSRRKKNSEEHILPLINIVFLLLIFFMIAGRLSAGDPIKLTPPTSLSDLQISAPEVQIHIGATGQFSFDNEIMERATLLDLIQKQQLKNADTIYRLKVDEGFSGPELLSFMAELKKRNVDKVYLFTLRKGAA